MRTDSAGLLKYIDDLGGVLETNKEYNVDW